MNSSHFLSDVDCVELSTFSGCIIQLSYWLWMGIVWRHTYGTELSRLHCKTGWEKRTAWERSVHTCRRHFLSFPLSTATGPVLPWGRGSEAVSSFWIQLVMCCKYLCRLASPSWLCCVATGRCVSGNGVATTEGEPWFFSLTDVIVAMKHQFSRQKRWQLELMTILQGTAF